MKVEKSLGEICNEKKILSSIVQVSHKKDNNIHNNNNMHYEITASLQHV